MLAKQLEKEINEVITKYYDDADEMWTKIENLIRKYSSDFTRVWLSDGMEIYAELLINDKEDEIYLLEIDIEDGARITEINQSNELFHYLLNFDSWKKIVVKYDE
ncbi:MAG: hypothetical protein QXQ37_06610 [Nitrososphaerota archaeon]